MIFICIASCLSLYSYGLRTAWQLVGAGYKISFFHSINNDYWLNFTLVSDRCLCSSAAETLVKYQCHLMDVRYTFTKAKYQGQLISLVWTLTPGLLFTYWKGFLSSLKTWDWVFQLSCYCEIWQSPWQTCCPSTCQISEWLDNFHISCTPIPHNFVVAWDLVVQHLIAWWLEALVLMSKDIINPNLCFLLFSYKHPIQPIFGLWDYHFLVGINALQRPPQWDQYP